MKLREEKRLRDKMEVQLETRQLVGLALGSLLVSGLIFASGLFVGQKKAEGITSYKAASSSPLRPGAASSQRPGSVAASLSFLGELRVHPEKQQIQDAVVNAMARLRLETLKRIEEEDRELQAELEATLFERADQRQADSALADEDGGGPGRSHPAIGVAGAHRPLPRSAPVPANLAAAAEKPEPPEAVVEAAEPPADVVGAPEVVAPGEGVAASAGQPALESEPAGGFAIQVKAFREKEEALLFLGYVEGELKGVKYKPFIMPVELPDKGKWYRVRVGRFPARLDAEKFKAQLEKRLGLETFLVSL